MRKRWLFLIALSVTLSVSIPLLHGGLGSLAELARIPGWGFAVLLLMVIGGWLFNSARVHLLTRSLGCPMSGRRSFGTVIAAEFAGVATPANAGEPATYLYLFSRHGFAVGRSSAMVAVDKSMDLIFFATTLPIALLSYALDGGIGHPLHLTILLAVLILIGLGTLVGLIRYYRPIVLTLGRILHRFPRLRHARFRLARSVIHFRQSVRLLLTMRASRLFLLYFFCLGHWMLRYSILAVLLSLMGASVPWGFLFVVQSLLIFAGQATFLPGGGGGVEIGFSALLSPYLDPMTSASALLVWRFFTFYLYLLAGAPFFLAATGKGGRGLVGGRSAVSAHSSRI